MKKILYITILFCAGLLCFGCFHEIAFSAETVLYNNESYTVTVSGTVVSDSQPIGEADVYFCIHTNVRSVAEHMTSTSSNGSFEFSVTIPNYRFSNSVPAVFIKKEGYALNIKRLNEKLSEFNVQFDLESPTPVTGYVRDSDGNAIAGKTVTPVFIVGMKNYSSDDIFSEVPGFDTVTNSNGFFELSCLSPGATAYLSVTAEGYAMKNIGPIRGGQRDFTIELIPEGLMSGRVIDTVSENPAANIIVKISSEMFDYTKESLISVTDSDGRYLFTNLEPGMYSISVIRPEEEYPGRVSRLLEHIEVR
ncbi:hypothetical protein ACFL50_05475, partial [Candidatus Latescibacterota bacterium]